MNDREKKLTLFLLAAVLLIGTMFLYTVYDAKMKKNKAAYKRDSAELARMKGNLTEAESRIDEMEWLSENPPVDSQHGVVSAELADFTEKSAKARGVEITKRPAPQDVDPNEYGAYSSAVVRTTATATDAQFYAWLVDLQSPNDHRSVTRLYVKPKRDDKTNTTVECELEVTQWFTPVEDEPASGEDEPASSN